jgi:hypothetical protein
MAKLNRKPLTEDNNTSASNQIIPKRGRGRLKGTKQKPAKKTRKKQRGRPESYNQKQANEICERLARGESLNRICKMNGMPSYATVMAWLWRKSAYQEDFLNKYALAREQQADFLADELLEIADDGTNDTYLKVNEDGSKFYAFDKEHIQRSRLRVDTRKWIASKLKPKKYGEKLSAEHSGPDGKPLIPQATTIVLDFSGT